MPTSEIAEKRRTKKNKGEERGANPTTCA